MLAGGIMEVTFLYGDVTVGGRVLTLHIKLHLRQPAFDVEAVVWSRLASISTCHVSCDVGEAQASVTRFRHPLARRHGHIFVGPGPEHWGAGLPFNQAHQLCVPTFARVDHTSSDRYRQDWRNY